MRSGPCVLHSMGWIPLDEETRCGFCWILSPGCPFFHSFFFSSSSPSSSPFFSMIKCKLESTTSVYLLSTLPLCLLMLLAFCPYIYFAVIFFLVILKLAIPPGRGGTLMFIKVFNVLCNYSGNTFSYYSLQ